jgi:hypothetical protein
MELSAVVGLIFTYLPQGLFHLRKIRMCRKPDNLQAIVPFSNN